MKDKTRVLIVNPVTWTCGPDRSLFQLIRHIDLDRFELYLAFPFESPVVEKFRPYAEEIIFIRGIKWYYRTRNPLTWLGFLAGTLQATPPLAKYVRAKGIDLIHGNVDLCLVPAFVGTVTRRPVIVHIRGLGPLDSALSRAFVWVMDFTSDRVVCVAGALRERYLRFRRSGKVTVVYNPVDPDIFQGVSGESVRGELGLLPGEALVTTIGALTPKKGQEYFIRAAALVLRRYANARFLLIGNEARFDSRSCQSFLQLLHQRAAELGLEGKLTFLGEQDSVLRHIAATDVFVLPSLGIDGCSRVLLEAMAAGKPVVATDVAGNKEVVADGVTGYIVPPANAEAMAACILSILEDPARKSEFGDAASQRVRKSFHASMTARQMEEIYLTLAESRTARK